MREDAPPPHAAPAVLVVDDDPHILALLSVALPHLGFRTWAAGGVREALALFEANGPDVAAVLSDVNMPEGGGQALLAVLRRLAPRLPFCFMSARPVPAALLDAGVAALPKPFDLARLAETLHSLVRRR